MARPVGLTYRFAGAVSFAMFVAALAVMATYGTQGSLGVGESVHEHLPFILLVALGVGFGVHGMRGDDALGISLAGLAIVLHLLAIGLWLMGMMRWFFLWFVIG
ncbi:hypothetical protein ACERK3_18015 [Phycisphaerales bacterium AB-hyl4]|uniref:Uncharacterized protein n=1 Tax=Natronomicrosphaera hydrolytica TaxID=3242702 RepID=A0ABV4UA52_9BACT